MAASMLGTAGYGDFSLTDASLLMNCDALGSEVQCKWLHLCSGRQAKDIRLRVSYFKLKFPNLFNCRGAHG